MPPETTPAVPQIVPLPLSDIAPSPLNPRKHFPDGPLLELADSIRAGMLPPERHRGYAVQWFGLSAVVVVLGVISNSNFPKWWRARRRPCKPCWRRSAPTALIAPQ